MLLKEISLKVICFLSCILCNNHLTSAPFLTSAPSQTWAPTWMAYSEPACHSHELDSRVFNSQRTLHFVGDDQFRLPPCPSLPLCLSLVTTSQPQSTLPLRLIGPMRRPGCPWIPERSFRNSGREQISSWDCRLFVFPAWDSKFWH